MSGYVECIRLRQRHILGNGVNGDWCDLWAIVHTYSLFFVVFLVPLPKPVLWFPNLDLPFASVWRGHEVLCLHKSRVSEAIDTVQPLAMIYIVASSPARDILHDLSLPFHGSILSPVQVPAFSASHYGEIPVVFGFEQRRQMQSGPLSLTEQLPVYEHLD